MSSAARASIFEDRRQHDSGLGLYLNAPIHDLGMLPNLPKVRYGVPPVTITVGVGIDRLSHVSLVSPGSKRFFGSL